MENKHKKLILLAEDVLISEESKQDPIFLTVDVKLCDSVLNANREGVTEAFIADVINRQAAHLCLPFYADKKNLLAKHYEQLGHLYNRVTRKFGTDMIGSMVEFYSETNENGVVSLYGKIRIPKRDLDIIYRLVELYEMERFAVSVELSYDPRELIITQDGTFIDASENSVLTGLCLVWKPACSDAYALDMVAEAADDSEEIVAEGEEHAGERGDNEPMEKDKNLTAEVAEQEVAKAEVDDNPASAVAEQTDTVAEADGTVTAEQTVATDNADNKAEPAAQEGTVAETQEATAEVIEHSVDTHESIDNSGWYGDKPVHIIEYHERIIETMEEAGEVIAELDKQVAELSDFKQKYDAIVAEANAKALAEKQEQAKAFAEKQGLNVSETAVAEAIEKLDYAKIAELTMSQVQETEPKPESKTVAVTLASYVEMDVSDDKYGGLLSRRSN